jgi:hypothetical protein
MLLERGDWPASVYIALILNFATQDTVAIKPAGHGLESVVSEFSEREANALPCLEPNRIGVGIELGRAGLQVEGYQPRPCGCEVGSQFCHGHVLRGPPISRVEEWRQAP